MEVFVVKKHDEAYDGTCESTIVAVTDSFEKADKIALAIFKDMEDKWAEDYYIDAYESKISETRFSLYHYDHNMLYEVTITRMEVE